ncbi:50d02286-f01f-4305-9e38-052ba12d3102 [Sclerotinia trifoliorum]|uniref:50d02286-f01f-4305-9e38-052ba12d3102 n=1 Tax=Sclerotinia trifoliorum TaxID=28548 RepID=A0A8H2VP09_9HELO|nr:50d02286-f01f-4305-9e38-052ba12d3102 [Sclerotinia trifoliorum]
MPPSKQAIQGDVLKPSAMICADNMSYGIDVQATKTFEPFPRLAIELRLNIWRLACPQQERLLGIRLHPVYPNFDLNSATPSILLVNHESRHEAENIYTKVRLQLDQAEGNRKMFRTFYINTDRDILCLDNGSGDTSQNYHFEGDFLAHYRLTFFTAGSRLRALFREMRIVKTSNFGYDKGMGTWFLRSHDGPWRYSPAGYRCELFNYMSNLKKLILSPMTFDMQGYHVGIPYCLSPEQQSVCIRDIRTYFEKASKENPYYSVPEIEIESGESPRTYFEEPNSLSL